MKNSDINSIGVSRECCEQIDVPTEEELKALDAMRNIKRHVRGLKKRLFETHSAEKERDPKKSLDLEMEISELKREWGAWEKERECAARKRMILLGHEDA